MSDQQLQMRRELEAQLIDKAVSDPVFRETLLSNPRSVVEATLGIKLPAETKISVVEEQADSLYLVLPAANIGAGELSDLMLEAVAGGGFKSSKFEVQTERAVAGVRG